VKACAHVTNCLLKYWTVCDTNCLVFPWTDQVTHAHTAEYSSRVHCSELWLCEAAEWSASSEGCFLKQADGSSYANVFQCLRLNYIVTEYNSALIVESDHIIPHGVLQFSQLIGMNSCTQLQVSFQRIFE